jgi:hypothetical protein
MGIGVGDGVSVGLGVRVGLLVDVGVDVGVFVGDGVLVDVGVFVGVFVDGTAVSVGAIGSADSPLPQPTIVATAADAAAISIK